MDDEVKSFQLEPQEYGFEVADRDTLKGGDARENSRIINEVISGSPGPKRDVVVLNAAAAFVTAGLDKDIKDGIQRAEEVIDSGRAKEKLNALVRFTSNCEFFVRK